VYQGATALLAASEAEWVMVGLEDAWGETRMQNLPGTHEEHPNWVSRARYAIEDFESVDDLTETLETMRVHRPSLTKATEGV
jgi:4-alpha-glucanotransferase